MVAFKQLSEIAEINPRVRPSGEGDAVSFVGMAQLDAQAARAEPLDEREFSTVSKGFTLFRNGDLLVAKITPCFENGKIGQACLTTEVGAGSTEFHVVRPREGVSVRYLLHMLRHPWVRAAGELRMTGSGGQRRVPSNFLRDLRMPTPAIDEQRRIAKILDQADAIRTKRRASLALHDELVDSLFYSLFISSGIDERPLGDLVNFYSGGTPAKGIAENWIGELPWFSPKDMKRVTLVDSRDHISRNVVHISSLRMLNAPFVAIVVRGMILAHSVPICKIAVDSTINQDLKALLPKVPMDVDFLASALRQRRNWILTRVSSSAHGTRRIETDVLSAVPVPVASYEIQQEFAARVEQINAQRALVERALEKDEELFASLQSRAFSGEL